ncbi:hypothetical protein F0M18_18155 [Pseudohalioglobus sediminis]|uniref:Uncharacterized protein n=1 Tax=Pseudohalioglobus sediminis TaxID=2606449 RepID=A0A5B0WMY1_9GAMM|nr:hypothetical protein [Pseudohalioglobus sediminis]KAA1188420.1 hypothetical protein F0M18_18155 [Pseudohalioglobus sediminis]
MDGLERLIDQSIEWNIQILPDPLLGIEETVLDELEELIRQFEQMAEDDPRLDRLSEGKGKEDKNPFAKDSEARLSDYELAALVCDLPMDADLRRQYSQLRVLFLGYAWRSSDSVDIKKRTALELRKIVINNPHGLERREYLGFSASADDVPEIDDLVVRLAELQRPGEESPPYLRDWYTALRRFFKFWAPEPELTPVPSKTIQGSLPSESSEERSRADSGITDSSPDNQQFHPFESALQKQISLDGGRQEIGEAPDQLSMLSLDIEGTPEALTVFLGSSRFWLQDIYNLTAISPEVLDEEEVDCLCEFFRSKEPTGTRGEYEARLILELSYVTGIPTDKLLDISIGPQGVINADGQYRRQIKQPTQSYIPDEAELGRYREILAEICLDLPDSVLAKLTGIMPTTKKKSLVNCLSLSKKTLASLVSQQVTLFNETYELDMSVSRVGLALRNRVYLKTKNPALTLHIAGLDGYAPPSMSWYQGIDDEALSSAYEQALEALYGLS